MKPKVLIYADGSSLGNPGPGGWGALLVEGDKVLELGGGDAHTTNNRMELTATIEALSRIKEKEDIIVRTDSRYVINGITKWIKKWEASGWKGTNKKGIMNRDLWEKLLETSEGKDITWEHVHGHAGVVGNERVDAIATRAATEKQFSLQKFYDGPLSGYKFDIFNVNESKKRPASRKNTGKAYSYLSLVDGVAMRHATWKECEARVKGVSGARFKKAVSKEDEDNILREWGATL